MKSLASLALVATVSCTLFACSASSTPDPVEEENVEQTEEALTACGAAKYNEALAHYKNAVAWSKDRLAQGVCNSENGYQWGIADEASRAVMTCGQFRSIIKTSPWAAPVRTVLAPSLTLRSITGELLVIKDSSFQNWTGVDRFFTSGLSFWARAEGAYGSKVRIDFKANGKATYGYLDYNEVTGDITWKSIPATYSIAKSTSREAGPRILTVTRAGKTEKFELGVENPLRYNDAPMFVLEPLSGSVSGTPAAAPKLYSLVSECDA
jgi:hypothetical protein